MICPGCNKRCSLDADNLYICRFCGARERLNTTGKGMMWLRDGIVIDAPEAIAEQLEKAEEREKSGDWVKARKKLYK